MGEIYKIENNIDHKIYIGKTIHTMMDRKRDHIYESKEIGKSHLHNAMNKHGLENFTWSVLEEHKDETILFDLEKKYIIEYRSNDPEFGYNLTIGGEGVAGRIIPEEENKRRSKAVTAYLTGRPKSEETKRKISITQTGKHLSKETKQKLSEALSGKKNPMYGKPTYGFLGKTHSEESKRRISENNGRVWLGQKMSDKTRQKISDWAKTRTGEKASMFGRHHSEETKKKMSEVAKARRTIINE
jgi:group I intron endonuclease